MFIIGKKANPNEGWRDLGCCCNFSGSATLKQIELRVRPSKFPVPAFFES
jgi:hypothetical protein